MARSQVPADSAYSFATTDITIVYQMDRDPKTGPVTTKAKSIPEKIDLKWQTSTGVPPADKILLIFHASYKGHPCVIRFKDSKGNEEGIARDADHYTIPLDQVATDLIEAIKDVLPPGSDPEGEIELDGPVAVMIAPVLPASNTAPQAGPAPEIQRGAYVPAASELNIALKRVLGDVDAYIALNRAKPAATTHGGAVHCPYCGQPLPHGRQQASPVPWPPFSAPAYAPIPTMTQPQLVPVYSPVQTIYTGTYPAVPFYRRYAPGKCSP